MKNKNLFKFIDISLRKMLPDLVVITFLLVFASTLSITSGLTLEASVVLNNEGSLVGFKNFECSNWFIINVDSKN